MASQILPYDVLFLIIDNIDLSSADGRQSLSAFSLSHRNLCVACQERMFEDIEITYVGSSGSPYTGQSFDFSDAKSTTGWKFRDLVKGSPHIGPYVRRLTIMIFTSTGPERRLAYSEASEFSLYDIVPRLPNLKGFLASHDGPFGWYNVGQRMCTFLNTVACSVTELDLTPFSSVPTAIFFGSNNLRALGISSLDMGESSSARVSVSSTKLHRLHTGLPLINNPPITTWFNTPQSPLDISELRSLKFSNSVALQTNLNGLLALCSSTLQELDFKVDICEDENVNSMEPAVDLGGTCELRRLIIRSNIRSAFAGPIYDSLRSISTIMKTLPFGKLQPQQLELEFDWTVLYLENFDTDIPSLPWFYIVDVLEHHQFMQCWSKINMKIRRFQRDRGPIHVKMSTSALTLIFDKNERMKKLRERGLLSYHGY